MGAIILAVATLLRPPSATSEPPRCVIATVDTFRAGVPRCAR